MRQLENKASGLRSAIAKRARRKILEREKRRVIRHGAIPRPHLARPGRTTYVRVVAPEELDLFGRKDFRSGAVAFLSRIRKLSRRPNSGVHIDLSQVTAMWAPTAVMIRAEIDRAVAGSRVERPFICTRPRNARMDEVFAQIGLYESIDLVCELDSDRDDVKHWRFATGVLSEGRKGGSLLEEYSGRLADRLQRGLYDGIVEAMTNTVQHAYLGHDGKRLRHMIGKRWWLLSQERDGLLTVTIGDLGIGISESLPRSKTFTVEAVRQFLKGNGLSNNDANAIRAAVELGSTRTKILTRGRGLHDIVEAANLSDGGRVMIGSNRGVFTVADGKGNARNYDESVRGTVIWWVVRIADNEQDGA